MWLTGVKRVKGDLELSFEGTSKSGLVQLPPGELSNHIHGFIFGPGEALVITNWMLYLVSWLSLPGPLALFAD